MIMNQLSVFLENKNGQLSEITGILADNGVDLKALNIAETNDYGILRLIVDDSEKGADVLSENGLIVSSTPVVCATVPNTPGGLHSLLKKLNDNDIGVEYMYSIFSSENSQAQMILKVDCPDKLESLL